MQFTWSLADIGTILSVALGLIALWATIIKPIKATLREIALYKSALRILLSAQIMRIHRDFMVIGKIDRAARSMALNLFAEYKSLGGDGDMDLSMDEIKKLPLDLPITPGEAE